MPFLPKLNLSSECFKYTTKRSIRSEKVTMITANLEFKLLKRVYLLKN